MFRNKSASKDRKRKAEDYFSKGQLDEAKVILLDLDDKNLLEIDSLLKLGAIFFEEENYAECEKVLLKALNLNANHAIILQNLGALYIRLNKLDIALNYIKKSLQIEPNNALAWNNLGLIYQKQGRMEEAETSFNRAIELDPAELEYVFNLGENTELKHDFINALEIYKSLLEVSKENQGLLNKKIMNVSTKMNASRLDRLKKTLNVSTKIKLDRLQDSLNMPSQEFNIKIVDWAYEFDFIIEGEYLITKKSTLSDFINSIDDEFQAWDKKSSLKEGKI